MNRETSAKAYNIAVKSGKVHGLQLAVLELVCDCNEPPTAGEIIRDYKLRSPKTQMNSLSPRFAELERRGLIQPAGERCCSVTGQKAITWEPTGFEPSKCERKTVGELAQLRYDIEQLRYECAIKAIEIQSLKLRLEKWGRPPNVDRVDRFKPETVQELFK